VLIWIAAVAVVVVVVVILPNHLVATTLFVAFRHKLLTV
jgi:hypothetical protein